MKQTLYQQYKDVAPIGAVPISNNWGLMIYAPCDNDSCDLVVAWVSGDCVYGYHRHMIHYTESGRGYIRKGNMRFYLDDILRVI